ncbi:uncharacterized protein F4812DRAFT_454220 [Daldinia caldariorum]|uniref:uncharacterized protein n=1 Tax=Daldinia caldariorum TaxID=326644 RepID=UPI00200845DC|nr:uncharacterized protein F4812DRAFT_454220 [Daldinia caldariorum]KAI1472404.1 hypothetical protein F4812DRAFT_454220 [Daldinia caldariorum]
MAQVTAAPPGWDNELKDVTTQLSTKLFDQEKAVDFTAGFDKDRVEKLILEVLNAQVPALVEVREEALKKSLADAEDRAKDEVAETKKIGKEELHDAEKKYNRTIDAVKKEMNEQIMEIEQNIKKYEEKSEELEKEKGEIKSKYKLTLNSREKDYKLLEKNYKKLVTERDDAVEDRRIARQESRGYKRELELETKYGQDAKARADRKADELTKAITSVRILNNKNIELERRISEGLARENQLQRTLDQRERDIVKLEKKLAEFARLRSGSVMSSKSGKSSSGSSVRATGNLGEELGQSEDRELILDLREDIANLEGEKDALNLEVGQVRQERDNLDKQLKKANDRFNEISKEVTRLLPFESRVNDLEEELNKANEGIKQLQHRVPSSVSSGTTYTTAPEFDAAIEKFEKEKADLADRIAQLEGELEQAAKDLKANPTGDELNELRRLLTKAEQDLNAEREASTNLRTTIDKLEVRLRDQQTECEGDARTAAEEHQARIDALQAEFDTRQKKTNRSRDELASYWEELGARLSARSQELQGLFQKDLALNHTTRDQYSERLNQMNEEIRRNPHTPETAVTRRRAAGLEREIERMNGIIRTLAREVAWFQDTLPELSEGSRRARAAQDAARSATEAAAAASAAARAQAEAEIAAHNRATVEARRGIWRDRWNGLRGLFWRDRWNIVALSNLVVMAAMLLTWVTLGRELGLWRAANAPVQRGFYVNTLDRPSICLRQPSWELLWEFIIVLLSGTWLWKGGI